MCRFQSLRFQWKRRKLCYFRAGLRATHGVHCGLPALVTPATDPAFCLPSVTVAECGRSHQVSPSITKNPNRKQSKVLWCRSLMWALELEHCVLSILSSTSVLWTCPSLPLRLDCEEALIKNTEKNNTLSICLCLWSSEILEVIVS